MDLKIASWNIAGGRKSNSEKQFDYEAHESISYFAQTLKQYDPDVICIQESHTNSHRSIAQEIATLLDFPYIYNSPASPSHIDKEYQLGNAIIAKIPFTETRTIFFPNPWFDLHFKDGRLAIEHPKNVQLAQINNNLWIANLHLLPLGLFGLAYDDGDLGEALARKVEQVLFDLPHPLILTGDFNVKDPKRIYREFFSKSRLDTVLSENSDSIHTYASPTVSVKNTQVIETLSDHQLSLMTVDVPPL